MPQLLRLYSSAREATAIRSPHAATRVVPTHRNYRKPTRSNKDSVQPKKKKGWKTDDWINKMYYMAIRRKEVLVHATTWMNLKKHYAK